MHPSRPGTLLGCAAAGLPAVQALAVEQQDPAVFVFVGAQRVVGVLIAGGGSATDSLAKQDDGNHQNDQDPCIAVPFQQHLESSSSFRVVIIPREGRYAEREFEALDSPLIR